MRGKFKRDGKSGENRVNREIRAPKVRVILDDGEMLGLMSSRDAYEEAQRRGLDLVEISPNANPPVCKIMDYGKFKYELKKKSQTQKKQVGNIIKEITLGPQTQEHDLNFKVKNAMRFLEEGHRVKFTVRFRGRQMAHPEIGRNQLDKVTEALKEFGQLELAPKMEGRFLASVYAPLPGIVKTKSKPSKEATKTKSEVKSSGAETGKNSH